MGQRPTPDQWVWVLIQDPGGEEQIVGQHDDTSGVSFLPVFLEKEDGLKCYGLLARDTGKKDEFQAILFEELARHAARNGFKIFILSGSGDVLERIAP
jgi:hypothetical protein